MTIFSCSELSKKFEDKQLFDEISFGLDEGERLGIIGKNGIGKTTLLKIIAGKEIPDNGSIIFNNKVRFEYLEQIPNFDSDGTILNTVMTGNKTAVELLDKFNEINRQLNLNNAHKSDNHDELLNRSMKIQHELEAVDGWNLENNSKSILSKLGFDDFNKYVKHLSGGLKKRVALARALVSEPDLLILDEPTNHLDADSVQWLQDRLQSSNLSIVFVTHDRYFLDALATKIIEIDQQKIFFFPGNFEDYLAKKEEILSMQTSAYQHQLSRLRTELAWLQKGARARRRKHKSRIDWVEKLNRETKLSEDKKIKIELGKSFLGSRIIDAHNIGKSIGGKLLFQDFTYLAKPGDRIGIIGPNGSGKSTLLNTLSGRIQPDSGTIKIGGSANIGYFTQDLYDLKDSQSLIGSLREVAEYIDVGEGRDRYLSCKDLLNRFLFPQRQHSNLISTLSGGEKRRLGLLRIFMANPNVIFLDEPTNDLDISTLNALEEYLENFYGVLLVVSHDRAFLDRTVNFILAFDGKGNIKEYPGNYSYYLEKKEQETILRNKSQISKTEKSKLYSKNSKQKKLSYKEQLEFDNLENMINELEKRKKELTEFIYSSQSSDYKLIEEKSHEIARLDEEIETAMFRWIGLNEKIEEMGKE